MTGVPTASPQHIRDVGRSQRDHVPSDRLRASARADHVDAVTFTRAETGHLVLRVVQYEALRRTRYRYWDALCGSVQCQRQKGFRTEDLPSFAVAAGLAAMAYCVGGGQAVSA